MLISSLVGAGGSSYRSVNSNLNDVNRSVRECTLRHVHVQVRTGGSGVLLCFVR